MNYAGKELKFPAGMFIVPNEAKPEIPVVDEGMNNV
jgi:hypothetical protein